MNSPYHVHSLMFGMKTAEGDQYLIGPAFKHFISDVGHQRSYLGVKVHTSIMIGRFSPFLSYEMLWGKYYMFKEQTDLTAFIGTRKQGKGVLGVGYAVNDGLTVYVGASPQDYDPLQYSRGQQTPYKSPSMVMKLSADVWTLFSK